MNEYHEEVWKMMLNGARACFEEDKKCLQTLFFDEGSEVPCMALVPNRGESDKRLLAGLMVSLVERGSSFIGYVCEAWAITRKPSDFDYGCRPSEAPDREELVIVYIETKSCTRVVTAKIDRTGAELVLQPWSFPTTPVEGRFVKLWDKVRGRHAREN